jgi:hypothetical protein
VGVVIGRVVTGAAGHVGIRQCALY